MATAIRVENGASESKEEELRFLLYQISYTKSQRLAVKNLENDSRKEALPVVAEVADDERPDRRL